MKTFSEFNNINENINFTNESKSGLEGVRTFKDGLTEEIIKEKYPWLLKAKFKDVVIGEDQNGLVWYDGIWYNGTWESGTWKDGWWYDGDWKNGTWENGIWKKGYWNLGKIWSMTDNQYFISKVYPSDFYRSTKQFCPESEYKPREI